MQKLVGIIGVPLIHGQRRIGVSKAPNALRQAGLLRVIEGCGWKTQDYGNIDFTDTLRNVPYNETRFDSITNHIYNTTRIAARNNQFTLALGGNHSISGGTIRAMRETFPSLGVVWVDAHADANTREHSPSGNYHGMVAAELMGWFGANAHLPENKLVYIGLRDLDPIESRMLSDSKAHVFMMSDIIEHGVEYVIHKTLEILHDCPLHLSLDIDSIDPVYAPGTGTPVSGGMTYSEVKCICKALARSGRMVSIDLVEINPELDEVKDEKLVTVQVGLELIKTVFRCNKISQKLPCVE